MSLRLFQIAGFVVAAMMTAAAWAQGTDRHVGIYYPEPQTSELYFSPYPLLQGASKRSRVGFTVGLNAIQMKRGYAPTYHLFAKGAESQKLIIVATGDGHYDTLFRMRGLLAALTAEARLSPMFRQLENPEEVNFFDLIKMTGFTQITVSDGKTFAHRVDLS
ncbi:MAG: hypothetical protein OXR62_09935 [Ahrensia sp.]|nr:hypothetical protein [Ahrensia sp.]